jgi:hypothetical protein
MTTPELDRQLRGHYGSFRRDHAVLRDGLLEQLPAENAGQRAARRAETTSRFFRRRLLMRLSAAAVVGLVVGVVVFLVNPGPQGTTWADVVKAIGPVESVQYRTSQDAGENQFAEVNTAAVNYVTPTAMRTDTWAGGPSYTPLPADMAAKPPANRRVVRRDGNEVTQYDVHWSDGRIDSVVQRIDYLCTSCPPLHAQHPDLSDAERVLAMWRALHNLPPESVLKRGSTEVDGQRLLRFQVIGGMTTPGAEGAAFGGFILVDPRTKRPVQLETGSTRWTDIRINEPIPADTFAAPAVPEDLDAEVTWQFTLTADAWHKPGFAFRVLDPQGKPVITEKDFELTPLGAGPGGFGGVSPEDGAALEPGAVPTIVSSTGQLTQQGLNKLDAFMARNPGAAMTIEITGEPPIKRQVYGRLSRDNLHGFGQGAVRVVLPTLADLKATTQPAQPGQPGLPGRPGAPAYGPEGMMEDGGGPRQPGGFRGGRLPGRP